MTKHRKRGTLAAITLAAAAVASAAAFAHGSGSGGAPSGPSSSQSAYVVPIQPALITEALLTTGDSVNNKPDGVTPYRMAGIPDGLGAFDNGNGTFTVLMNHELGRTSGVVRAHGAQGRLRLQVDDRKDTLERDQRRGLDPDASCSGTAPPTRPGTTAFTRLCSATCRRMRRSTTRRPARATTAASSWTARRRATRAARSRTRMDGTSWELPALGRFVLGERGREPERGRQDRRRRARRLDAGPGVRLRRHRRARPASPVDEAGLTNGKLFGIKVAGLATETNVDRHPAGHALRPRRPRRPYELDGRPARDRQRTRPASRGSTARGRRRGIPSNPNDFYFVTTNAFNAPSRLWRLTFADPRQPGGRRHDRDGRSTAPRASRCSTTSR